MSDADIHIDEIVQWVRSFPADIAAVKMVVGSAETSRDARKLAAAALSYLVTRMDLVPDWTETIGVIDDVFVVRTCLDLASGYGVADKLADDARRVVGRMANDVEIIQAFLGDDLYSKLRKHCARLVDKSVRDRTTDKIVDDPNVRDALFAEVDADLLRMPAASFEDRSDVAVRLKSYLHHKLK